MKLNDEEKNTLRIIMKVIIFIIIMAAIQGIIHQLTQIQKSPPPKNWNITILEKMNGEKTCTDNGILVNCDELPTWAKK